MNKILPIIAIIIVALIVIFTAYTLVSRKKFTDKLTNLLYSRKFKEFNELATSKEAEKLIHPFNLNYMKLNALMMQNKNFSEQLKYFDTINMSDRQIYTLHSNLFYYYISNKDFDKATDSYEAIELLKMAPNKKEIERSYNTFVLKKYDYLDETLELLDKVKEQQKPAIQLLISKMYENKGDVEKSKEYFNAASNIIKHTQN